MEIKKIEDLIYDWHEMTGVAIAQEGFDFRKLQKLFRETYGVIEKFSKEKLVPKQMSELLLEMNDFGWWITVPDLGDAPLHEFYQEMLSLIAALNKYFLTRDYNVAAIEKAIENISEAVYIGNL